MSNADTSLSILKANFLSTSTQSMPFAGIIFWSTIGIAGFYLSLKILAIATAFGSGAIFPLAVLIDKLRGRNLIEQGKDNPLTKMFLQSLCMVALLWPLVILGGMEKPVFVVLGAAILTGIVWIPYGWAAEDPVGRHHAIARGVLCYLAYIFVLKPYKASAICAAVLFCYCYSLAKMRRP